MNLKNKKTIIALIVVAVVFGAIVFLALTGKLDFLRKIVNLPLPTNEIAGQDAYFMALQKAKEWQADAVLVYLSSGELSKNNGADSWNLIFVSPQVKQKGFAVKIAQKQIISSNEIDYQSQGEIVPLSFAVTPEQAVAKVKAMPDYQGVQILSVDAVYGKGTKTWYWGVKTSKGTVSVEAR